MSAPHPALALIGTPYQRGGASPLVGFDCFTLMAFVRAEHFELPTPIEAEPGSGPAAAALACARGIARALAGPSPWQRLEAPAQGCAVGLGRYLGGRLHHCGVWIGGGLLHSLEGVGVCWVPGERLPELYSRREFFECRL